MNSCGQSINGTLTNTSWSPDSSLYVEVYKEHLTMALPGQGGDHSAIVVLRKKSGEIIQKVDKSSSSQILHRDFHRVGWSIDKNMLSYAPGRFMEWVDEDGLDLDIIRKHITAYLGYDTWKFFETPEIFGDRYFAIGEFFDDPEHDYTLDMAILLRDSTSTIKLLMFEAYNFKHPFDGMSFIELQDEYSWAGRFNVVKAGSPLWSNWDASKGEEGRRELKEVPDNEIIYLEHDALYLHEGEACGGGFIYRKEGKWNWLQQE